jgi:hypothetical protein
MTPRGGARACCAAPATCRRALQQGTCDSGQALAESIIVGLLLLVPLIWALGVAAELHRGALAATAAAREAGVGAASSTSVTEAEVAVATAVDEAFVDHGLDARAARVSMEATALGRGDPVAVEVSFPVRVVGVPVLGRLSVPVIWVRARHVARVEPFASRGTGSAVPQDGRGTGSTVPQEGE